MCIEVYHPDQSIVISYEVEIVDFVGPRLFVADYTLLIKNSSDSPLSILSILFPRGMYVVENDEWRIRGVTDVTNTIPQRLRNCRVAEDRLIHTQPDPNSPDQDRDPLDGQWLPEAGQFEGPHLDSEGITFLNKTGNTFLKYNLGEGNDLAPSESRWFSWRFQVDRAGTLIDKTPLPGTEIAYHHLSSPIDVRRTIREEIQVAKARGELRGQGWTADALDDLLGTLGMLPEERNVDIEYYELLVQPGPPRERAIIAWQTERDLRWRNPSPRWGRVLNLERVGELVYQWKSGSILEPAGPWHSDGFILHLTLLCRSV